MIFSHNVQMNNNFFFFLISFFIFLLLIIVFILYLLLLLLFTTIDVSGGLFEDDEDPTTENAFRYGIQSVNSDKTVLSETRLSYDIQHLPARNSFIGSKKGNPLFRYTFIYLLTNIFYRVKHNSVKCCFPMRPS